MNTNAPDMPAPTSTSPIEKPRAFVGLRLLSLVYDVFPVVALWMLAAAGFTFLYFVTGHVVRENIQPFSSWQWFLWVTCFFLTGGYAVLSWHLFEKQFLRLKTLFPYERGVVTSTPAYADGTDVAGAADRRPARSR